MDTRPAARTPVDRGPDLRMPASNVEDHAPDLEAIGHPVGCVIHEFNNLVGIIACFAGFLAADLEKDTDSHRHATCILTACDQARALAARSLASARADRVPRRPADLRAVLRECRELLGGILPASIRLEFSFGDEALRVCGNIGEFSQIIVNLCLNARDALEREPGAITVRLDRVGPGGEDDQRTDDGIRLHAPSTQVRAGRLDEQRAYARISVADTGTGIDPEIIPRIFESFFTTKAVGRGAGLGLHVVHSIVLSYGGACRVESTPGRGTTFMVYLPLAASAAPAAAERANVPSAKVYGSSSCRI